jgi:hypothetical protein
MPALFAYLIAVTLLLGGGYGALNWLATPEPVKVAAKATPKPPPHYADNSGPGTRQASAPQVNPPEPSKPEAPGKPETSGTDQVKAAANNNAVSSEQPPPASSPPQPEPPAAASQQEAKAEVSDPALAHRDLPAQVERPQAATDQGARQQHGEAPPAEARQDDPAPARHEEQKQSTQAAPPGNAQTVASIAPAAKAAKRPHVRQASHGLEKRPLEVMTLRTIELPDGRRMTQLIPYRGGDRYQDDGPATVFGPDE